MKRFGLFFLSMVCCVSVFANTFYVSASDSVEITGLHDGDLDLSFDDDGLVKGPHWNEDYNMKFPCASRAMALQDDGKIVVGGVLEPNYKENDIISAFVQRYNIVGSLNTPFDSDGKIFVNFNDGFRISAISNGLPSTVRFYSSSNRIYTLLGCTNLMEGAWTNVPGIPQRMGVGGANSLEFTNGTPSQFYKLNVELP